MAYNHIPWAEDVRNDPNLYKTLLASEIRHGFDCGQFNIAKINGALGYLTDIINIVHSLDDFLTNVTVIPHPTDKNRATLRFNMNGVEDSVDFDIQLQLGPETAADLAYNDANWFLRPQQTASNVQAALDQISTFLKNAYGDKIFYGPSFYVTDGAPPPDTSLFSRFGNTLATAFGSMNDLKTFLAGVYVKGNMSIDAQGLTENITIDKSFAPGAETIFIRPRDYKAFNHEIRYAYAGSNSDGLVVKDGSKVILDGGALMRCGGVGNNAGGANIGLSCTGAGSSLGIFLDGTSAYSYLRHVGDHPLGANPVYIRSNDSGGVISMKTSQNGGSKNNSSKEIFNFNTPISTAHYFSAVDRVGDGSKTDIIGVDRVYTSDLHTIFDVMRDDDGFASYRIAGDISGSSYGRVRGPGYMKIVGSKYHSIHVGGSWACKMSNPDDSLGTSIEDYVNVMRMIYRDNPATDLEIAAYKTTRLSFIKQSNVTGSGTYGPYIGTLGNDLPAGV